MFDDFGAQIIEPFWWRALPAEVKRVYQVGKIKRFLGSNIDIN